ncbi:triose-phosphate isomerase [Candidatus Dependentiae bacterium]
MNRSPFLYVANWKMQLSFNEAFAFYQENKERFESLATVEEHQIVLCPSFEVLHPIMYAGKESSLLFGAQDCSAHDVGAYTGQVSAASLAQIGCSYCIVGHSEYRARFVDSDADIAGKVLRLLTYGVTPIICVGEAWQEYEKGLVKEVIDRQISTAFQITQQHGTSGNVCIAYEPIWAIGTGKVPSVGHIESVFEQISETLGAAGPGIEASLLYGGSVSGENVGALKQISGLEGFLIGSASLDFQKFEKIVTWDK